MNRMPKMNLGQKTCCDAAVDPSTWHEEQNHMMVKDLQQSLHAAEESAPPLEVVSFRKLVNPFWPKLDPFVHFSLQFFFFFSMSHRRHVHVYYI